MKIFCIGRNYVDHAKELGNQVPSQPLVFMKPSTAMLKQGDAFYHPDFCEDIHYEVEVVLKIAKHGKSIQPKFALDYIDQVGLGIDMTARDLQSNLKSKGHPWEIAKAFDQSAVVGDFISVSDAGSLDQITFSLSKNGEIVQEGNTKDLLFDFSTLICHLSKYFTLQKGDLIYTGTPAGVGKISIGDKYEGKLLGKHVLSCEIK